MALLSPPLLSLSCAPYSPSLASPSPLLFRLQSISLDAPAYVRSSVSYGPVVAKKRGVVAAVASADVDDPMPASVEGDDPFPASVEEDDQPETKQKKTPFEEIPLETKMAMIAAQRLMMKIAKKARQKRNRLVRKRRLRKKGRWPPSKMKKNKNV